MLLKAGGSDPDATNTTIKEYVASFHLLNEEEKAEIIGLFRMHGFKE
jgi:hypothetical protein